MLGNLFCIRYKYTSLKYGLIKYPACISFTVTGKCVPFRAFLFIIFNFYLYQPVFVKTFALICLYSLDLAILVVPQNMIYLSFGIFLISHLLDMENSKPMLMSWSNASISNSRIFIGVNCVGISVGLGGGL